MFSFKREDYIILKKTALTNFVDLTPYRNDTKNDVKVY